MVSQQGKTKLKVCWTSINNKKSKVCFLAYFMRILNSCVV